MLFKAKSLFVLRSLCKILTQHKQHVEFFKLPLLVRKVTARICKVNMQVCIYTLLG
jgi:hypothetical protein